MLNTYSQFLNQILSLIQEQNNWILPVDYIQLKIWAYTKALFDKHSKIIEILLSRGYVPDNVFLRETLSWDYAIIYLYESDKFEESYLSWKSDLVPSVTFSYLYEDNDGTFPVLRIEFSDSWIAWID